MAKSIDDLRRARKAAADKMGEKAEALAALEAADTPNTEAISGAEAEFATAQADFEAVDKQVKRAEAVESAQAAAAVPGDAGSNQAPLASAVPKDPEHKGVEVGLIVGALAAHKGDVSRAVAQLDKAGFSQVAAALNATDSTAGGVTVPRPLASDLIEMLRPRVVVRRAGVKVVPMPAGQLRKARQAASASAGYGGENVAPLASAPAFDSVDQSFKKLRAIVPISNSLLAYSSIQMGMLVRDDLLKVMGAREDLAFLRGDGTNDTPKGMRSYIPAGNWIGSVAGTDVLVIDQKLRKLVSLVEDSNVLMVKPGWVMRPGAKNFLAALKDANGNKMYPSIDDKEELMGFPIYTTTQLPNNLGTNSDETEVMFADFSYLMIGESGVLRIAQSTDAAYLDASGTMQSAFANDQTLMRAISEHDFAPEHDVALAGLQGVGWAL
ncbi:HK97 family phage major capsid protein [Rhodobacter sp. JA431]|uniref:phage major capsid protein n=1 Tax=Rhodobacter sp. JA431 TaxID=570013 RepID=UPI000BCB3510|nr:phage major capsid protein [Rhodobacter sp. JA431]SOC11426.1 HK97 family phage major capsid protein [Rhodobacter sp. JA431]